MRRKIAIILLISLPLLFVNCSDKKQPAKVRKTVSLFDKYSYSELSGKPSKTWVGKYLKIGFNIKSGKSLAGKTKIIHLLSSEKDSDGYLYFNVKDLSNGYLQEVYYFWFLNVSRNKNEFGPTIISWQEAIPK